MKRFIFTHSGRIIVSAMAILLAGCAVGPNYHTPPAPNTDRYTYKKLPKKTVSTHNRAINASKGQVLDYNQSIPKNWWKLFHSTSLNLLIRQGLKNNQTLLAAKQTLLVAQHTLSAQIGGLMLPAVDLAFNAQKTRFASLDFGSDAPSSVFSVYNTQAQASYTFDLFGGNRRTIEYYSAQVDYQKYELLAAYLSITANISTTAITIASLEDQIRATQSLIKAERKVLAIQTAQLRFGGISQQDVLTQQTLLAQTLALLPPLKKSLSVENSALAVLTGQVTSKSPPLHLKLNSLNLPKHLPVSLPSILVEQRPDILASSALLHGMSAKIGVATANLLPKINLTADYGWTAAAPSELFLPATNVWSIVGGLLQPFFHGGQLIAQRRAAYAEFREYYDKYQGVVLQAFKEVSDALNAIQFDAKSFKAEMAAETSAKRSLDTSLSQYKLGGKNYLVVLNAQQTYLQNKINRIKAQAARYTATAELFQALGGGWWDIPILPTPKNVITRRLKK